MSWKLGRGCYEERALTADRYGPAAGRGRLGRRRYLYLSHRIIFAVGVDSREAATRAETARGAGLTASLDGGRTSGWRPHAYICQGLGRCDGSVSSYSRAGSAANAESWCNPKRTR